MKIIQIIETSLFCGVITNRALVGLSDEGKLYRWFEGNNKDSREGWKLIEDEINIDEEAKKNK
jgi:hypothetical protein